MAHFYAPNFSGLLPLFDGQSAAGGKLYAYRAGSSIPAPLFNEDGVELGSWVSIDSNGCADFLLDSSLSYKLVVKDALGATAGEWDNVKATNAEGMDNPMQNPGDLIVGGTGGTATALPIGTEGQVLKVVSGAPAWGADTAGMSNPMTTEGDLIVGTTDGEPARIGAGTTGQVLKIGADGTPGWAADAEGMSNPMTTAGDIIVGGASGTPDRLGAGTDGNVLTMVNGAPAWAAPGGGGGGGSTGILIPFGPMVPGWVEYNIPTPQTFCWFGRTALRNCRVKKVLIGTFGAEKIPTTNELGIYAMRSNRALTLLGKTSTCSIVGGGELMYEFTTPLSVGDEIIFIGHLASECYIGNRIAFIRSVGSGVTQSWTLPPSIGVTTTFLFSNTGSRSGFVWSDRTITTLPASTTSSDWNYNYNYLPLPYTEVFYE